jgi:hypothetical protein
MKCQHSKQGFCLTVYTKLYFRIFQCSNYSPEHLKDTIRLLNSNFQNDRLFPKKKIKEYIYKLDTFSVLTLPDQRLSSS